VAVMDILACIKERRSVRKFTDEPVSREQIIRLLEAAVWAPSGGNRQTWRFVAVDQPETVRKVKMVSPGMGGVPGALIAIAHDMDLLEHGEGSQRPESIAKMDSAMAAQNILLAARAMDLGSCVIASFHAQGVAKVLNLPQSWRLHLLVSLGHPAMNPKPPARKFEEIIWWEKYDG
jgi:nitroreductase